MLLEMNPRSAPADIDVPGLQRKIHELVEGYPVTLKVVESIPQTLAGKHRIVMSDLATALIKEKEKISGTSGCGSTLKAID